MQSNVLIKNKMLKLSNLIIKQNFTKEVPKINEILKRFSSYRSSNKVRDINEYPQVEILKNPPEWKYVEMLIKSKTVPTPTKKQEYPSGWTPVTADPSKEKYFVNRTRNFMIPVYLKVTHRGERRLTCVKRIEGDIWLLEKDIRQHIESNIKKIIATRLNELSGQIVIHGDHVNLVKSLLISKGF